MDSKKQDKTIRKDKNTRNLVVAGLLLACALVIQFIGRFNPDFSRLFVGPLINAIILLAIYFASPKYGFLVATLTPILALAVGQLNPALMPMVPFIIIANLLYAFIFALFRRNNLERIISGIVGSLVKFAFLYLSIKVIVPNLGIIKEGKILEKLPLAFGTIQLVAALLGLVVALIFIDILNRILKQERYSMKI